jgi:hypothetical protein
MTRKTRVAEGFHDKILHEDLRNSRPKCINVGVIVASDDICNK